MSSIQISTYADNDAGMKLIRHLFIQHPEVKYITVDASGRFSGWVLKFNKPLAGSHRNPEWYSDNQRSYYDREIKSDFSFPTAKDDWRELFFSRDDYIL